MIKKSDVKIGGVYTAKIANRLVQVRIDAESRYGGWDGTNLADGKKARIKNARILRAVAETGTDKHGTKSDKGCRNPTIVADPPPVQTSLATIENTADIESAPVVCPNCSGTEVDEDGDCAKCHEPKASEKASEAKRTHTPKEPKGKRPSGLDAAAKVLEETGQPMNVKEIVEVAFAKGYWKPAGRTPSATLAAALIREIATKAGGSRFRKSARGKFVLNR